MSAGAEPIVGRIGSAVGAAVGAAASAWDERPGARVRRVRRLASHPLPALEDVHPEAQHARPRERGLETIPTGAVRGTAVAGPAQRGGDFLPLRPFRTANWRARWQRLRAAADRLDVLPPIDVVRYGDDYWVVDGHNRVAAALYGGQVEIDANVVDLVPPGGSARPPSGPLAPSLVGSRALRSAAGGRGGTGPRHEDEETARRELGNRTEGGEAGE